MSDRVRATFQIVMDRSDSIFSEVLAEHGAEFTPTDMADPNVAEAFLRSAMDALFATLREALDEEATDDHA